MAYKPKNFSPKELVSKKTYEQLGGDAEKVFAKFNQPFLEDIDNFCTDAKIELKVKKVLCNTWAFGGKFDDRGFRGDDSDTGSKGSMHRFGRAIDLEFYLEDGSELEVSKIQEFLLKGKKAGKYKSIKRIEIGVTWNHFDNKDTGSELYGFHATDSNKSKILIA